MRSSLFKYFILLLLGLAFTLKACAPGDPAVTPDVTAPSTLKVVVTITEDQDASDTKNGASMITLQFSTNEIREGNPQGYYTVFTHGESIDCNGHTMTLGNAPNNYWFRIINIPSTYYCNYSSPYNKTKQPVNIFTVPGTQKPLSPKLVRAVIDSSNAIVTYTPEPNTPRCTVEASANASNGNVTGDAVTENGTYSGLNVSSLSGRGYLIITQTCTWGYDQGNTGDNGSQFASLSGTYMTSAGLYVTWAQPNSPTQGTT